MNKIEQMLQELCPEGVEYKKLGEVCEILDYKRKPVAKGRRTSGIYPYFGANGIQDYVNDYIFDGTFILLGEDGSVINADKSPVLNWAVGKIWVNNHAHILAEISSIANLRYLYFALQTKDVSGIVRGTPPKLNQENLRNIEIPIPPLPIQEEIVRILDHFTELTASLQAELQARQEQYEYYRNKLLTFTKIGGGTQSVTWMKISEVAEIGTGNSNRQDAIADGAYPFFVRSKNVFHSGTYEFDEEAVIIPGEGGIGDIFHYVKGKYALHQRVYRIHLLNDRINTRFLYYYMWSHFKLFIMRKAVNATVTSIRKPMIEKFEIPIIPLTEQQRIVSILDKFETLVNDLSQGLPAEIAAVQEQYEYYRNKLLSFNRIN